MKLQSKCWPDDEIGPVVRYYRHPSADVPMVAAVSLVDGETIAARYRLDDLVVAR